MIRHERRERVQATLEIAEVVCDRCGESLPRVHGVGVSRDWEVKGSMVRGNRYPTHNADDHQKVEAELCLTCTDELVAWIDAGEGPGVRVQTSKEMSDALQEEFRRAGV